MKNVFVRKTESVKKPKFDITELMDIHANTGDNTGVFMARSQADDTMNILSADVETAQEDSE